MDLFRPEDRVSFGWVNTQLAPWLRGLLPDRSTWKRNPLLGILPSMNSGVHLPGLKLLSRKPNRRIGFPNVNTFANVMVPCDGLISWSEKRISSIQSMKEAKSCLKPSDPKSNFLNLRGPLVDPPWFHSTLLRVMHIL